MLKKASLANLAASVTGASVKPSANATGSATVTYTTLDAHNLYPGAKVTITGLTSSDSNSPNLVNQLVGRITSPTSFSVDVPWTYTSAPTITLTGGNGVYGTMYAPNGALAATNVQYGQPVLINRPTYYNYTYPTISAVGWGTGVKLNWTAIGIANPAVDSIKVERLSGNTVVATVSTSATGVDVLDGSLSTVGSANLFSYRVTVHNSVQSNIAADTAETLWFGPIAGLEAAPTSGTDNTIYINWATPSGNATLTNFELERATNSAFTSNATIISTAVAPSTTSWVDTTVATNTSYYYRVRARGDYASATSVYSAYATTSVSANPYYITAPASITVTPTSSTANQLSVSWIAVSSANPNISSYTLQEAYSTDGGTTWSAWTTATSTSGTTYTKVSATSGYYYKYQVQAVNSQLTSTTTTSTATAPYYLIDPLTAPGVTHAASTNVNLVVSGSYNSNPSITGYVIRRSSDGGTTWTNIGATDYSITLPYTDTSVARNTTYVYAVKAVNGQLTDSNWSDTSSAVTTYTVPTMRYSVALQALAYNTVKLTWNTAAVSSPDTPVLDYKIERATNSSFTANLTTVSSTATGTTYSDVTCSELTTYYYRVSARNGIGYSSTLSAGPIATPAQAITTTLNVNAISSVSYGTGATASGSISPNPAGGSVTITEGGTTLSTAAVSTTGSYSVTLPPTSIGTHNLSLAYGGSGVYQPSSTTTSYVVNAITTSITASASPASPNYLDTVTISGTVSGSPGGGTITISNGATTLATTSVTVGTGAFSVAIPNQVAGTYTLTVSYGAYLGWLASSTTTSVTIGKASLTLTAAIGGTINQGSSTTVSGSLGLASKTVSVYDSANTLITSTTTDSSGNYSVSVTPPAGTTSYYTKYAGDSNYNSSTSSTVSIYVRTLYYGTVDRTNTQNTWKWYGSTSTASMVASTFTMDTPPSGYTNLTVYSIQVVVAGYNGNSAQIVPGLWDTTGSPDTLVSNGGTYTLPSKSGGSATMTTLDITDVSVVAGRVYSAGFWRKNNSTSYYTQFDVDTSSSNTLYYDDSASSIGNFTHNETFSGNSLRFKVNYYYYR